VKNGVEIINFGCSVISDENTIIGKEIPSEGTPEFKLSEVFGMIYTGEIFLKDLDLWTSGCIMYDV
jgi:hypothetical protein